GVGHRVFVAGNELVAVEQLLESIETTPDHAQLDLLHFRRQVRVEERADLLVYFGRCEVQRFHQAVALHGSRLGNKPGLGFLVAEVLADDRDLGQDLSVVQHESRNVALGVDLPIMAAVGGLLVGDVNPLEIEGVSGFASHDVRGHGAGAAGLVELHLRFLSRAVDWANSRLEPLSRGEVRCGSFASILPCPFSRPLSPTADTVRHLTRSPHRRAIGLLRPRHERPGCRCAAESQDELAPLHSITSSATPSNLSGTSSPSAFAVLRLITNSNFVGCMPGRSAGFSPFRIRPAYPPTRRYTSGKFGP